MVDVRAQAYIKKIKLLTRRLVNSPLMGDYSSAFRGVGMEFEQLRDYMPGDDVRFIDWKSTARSGSVKVKQFLEERDRSVILLLDISPSTVYGSGDELKSSVIAQVASILALVAGYSKDKVGLAFFSDEVYQWHAPRRGMAHINRMLKLIFSCELRGAQTNVGKALDFLLSCRLKNATVFLISDMIDHGSLGFEKILKVAARVHDFTLVRVLDDFETSVPNLGFVEMQDPETQETIVARLGTYVDAFIKRRLVDQSALFRTCGVDIVDLRPSRDFICDLSVFFHKRIRRSFS